MASSLVHAPGVHALLLVFAFANVLRLTLLWCTLFWSFLLFGVSHSSNPGDVMSFNPSGLTVKKAIAKLAGMLDEDLSAVYDAELEGKGRKSLLDAITSARDDIREAVVEEEVVVAAEPG